MVPPTVSTGHILLDIEEPVFNFSFPRTSVETGQQLDLTVGVERLRDIQGDLEVELVGLPNGVSSPAAVQNIVLTDTQVTFPLVIDPKAKTGKHKTLVIQTRIKRDGETMTQTDGRGELRIDKPIAKKPIAKKPNVDKKKEAKPKPKSESKKAPKPLSRLEQLRRQKEAP